MRMCAWRVPCRFWLVCTMSTLLVLLALAPALHACCPDTSVVRHALTSGSFGRPLRAVLNTSDFFAGPARREMILFADGLLGFFGSSGPANAEQLDAERTLRRSIIVAHCVRPPGRPPDDDGVVASSASSDVRLLGLAVAAAKQQLRCDHAARMRAKGRNAEPRPRTSSAASPGPLPTATVGRANASCELSLLGSSVAAAELQPSHECATKLCADGGSTEHCLCISRAAVQGSSLASIVVRVSASCPPPPRRL